MSYFTNTAVNIEGNRKLRTPQIEAYIKIRDFFSNPGQREALVVLPTGTGKSGLISIAPYGVSQKRVLIITPGLVTKDSIRKTQEVLEDNFWINYDIVFSSKDIPVVSEYVPDISPEHLEKSHIIFSNIQRISGNRKSALINRVPEDFLILSLLMKHIMPQHKAGVMHLSISLLQKFYMLQGLLIVVMLKKFPERKFMKHRYQK